MWCVTLMSEFPGPGWWPECHLTFLRPWVKSKFASKIHAPNHVAALWAVLLGLPVILAVTMRNVKIHLCYRLTISSKGEHLLFIWNVKRIELPIATHSLELWSVPAEQFFFLRHRSAVKWTRTSYVLGVSSQGCCRELHGLHTARFHQLPCEWRPLELCNVAALSICTYTHSLLYSGEKLITK